MTSIIFALLGGIAIGLTVAFVLRNQQAKQGRELAEELFREAEAQRKAGIDAVIENVKASFGAMSLEALSKSTEEFLKLAKARLDTERETSARELDSKKGLIDQQLQAMTVQMEQVSRTINELEKDRVEKFGQLSSSLLLHAEQTQSAYANGQRATAGAFQYQSPGTMGRTYGRGCVAIGRIYRECQLRETEAD